MRKISNLTVKLRPFKLDLTFDHYVLITEVNLNGKNFSWSQALDEDDVESMLHRLMERAEAIIERAIKEDKENAKPE
jgi:hypothetical protein